MDIEKIRKEFPVTGNRLFMDHARVAPLPRPVQAAITAFAEEACEQGTAHYSEWLKEAEIVRARFAQLINADPGEVAFVKNTSEGLSIVANGIDWKEGDNVVIPEELNQLGESVDFLLNIRNELHYQKGKKSDVLEMDLQKELAAHLGYRGEDSEGDAESFMRDYFMHATRIRHISSDIFHRCLEVKPTLQNILTHLQQTNLENGFIIKKNKLSAQDLNEDLFKNDLSLFLKVFQLCQQYGLQPDTQLNRLIRQNADLVDSHYIASPKVAEFLFGILDHPHSENVLRLMHEANLLARLVPEFGQSQYRISYDFYHRNTADEHALRMIHFLESLPDLPDEGLKKFQDLYDKTDHRAN